MKSNNKIQNTKKLLKKINVSLQNDKAIDIKSIDLLNRSSIADYMVIATGNSSRQVASISKNLIKKLKELGFYCRKPEGLVNSDWVLIDAYDVVVHIFRPEVREFYGLEKMWDMPNIQNTNINKTN